MLSRICARRDDGVSFGMIEWGVLCIIYYCFFFPLKVSSSTVVMCRRRKLAGMK